MRTYNTKSGQNIYDLCLILYGDTNYITKLMDDNNIEDFNEDMSNRILIYDEQIYNNNVFISQNFNIATDENTNYDIEFIDAGFDEVQYSNYMSLIQNIEFVDAGFDEVLPDSEIIIEFVDAGFNKIL